MSTRAIRKLRGDDALMISQLSSETDDEDNDNDSDEDELLAKGKSTFLSAFDDDDDDEEEEDSSLDSHDGEDKISVALGGRKDGGELNATDMAAPADGLALKDDVRQLDEKEDFDTLISEFQEKDGERIDQSDMAAPVSAYFSVLIEGMDTRHLDIDFSQAQALSQSSDSRGRTRSRHKGPIFGPPRDGWKRPPHFVGGGMGMTSYDREPHPIPWPYTIIGEVNNHNSDARDHDLTDKNRWFCFTQSDNYRSELEDFKRIQDLGDANALLMFVAHHPYVCEALLQSSLVMYQTNHSLEGQLLLKRCLWIFECAMLTSFVRDSVNGGGASSAFLDMNVEENTTFFRALWKLVHVSSVASLPRTSLAVCRFLLSLDPLRDPMGVLLVLDHFALSTDSAMNDQWLVHLVESDRIEIWYRDQETTAKTFHCSLVDLPNFSFSYALALFRLSTDSNEESFSRDIRSKADNALKRAIIRFPSVIGLLLQKNDVDTSGRSFRRDWITLLDYASREDARRQKSILHSESIDPVDVVGTLQATQLIIDIFVKQNASLWSLEQVLNWVYDVMKDLQADEDSFTSEPPSPALMRYLAFHPSDYDPVVRQLPPEANIVDPNVIAHAMVVDPNRRRFLRRPQRDDRGVMGAEEGEDAWFPAIPAQVIGGPPNQIIDPDWPLMEVFWRSFLPWNRVDGVPPPRR